MPPLEVGLLKFEFDGGELPLQDRHEKVSAPADRLQEAGVDPLGFVLNEIQHRLDHPLGGEYFTMVGDSLF